MSFLRPVLLTRRTHLTLVQLSDVAVYPAMANETLFHVINGLYISCHPLR